MSPAAHAVYVAGDGVQAEIPSENRGGPSGHLEDAVPAKRQFGDASEREFSARWRYVKFTSLRELTVCFFQIQQAH